MTDAGHRCGLREQFSMAIEGGDLRTAIRSARALLCSNSGSSLWSVIRKAVTGLPLGANVLYPLKVALLSSFTSEFLHDPIIAYAFLDGIRVEIFQAGFGQYQQEILDADSDLYRWKPDVVILAVEGEVWAPFLYDRYEPDIGAKKNRMITQEPQSTITNLLRTFRSRCTVPLFIHNLFPPVWRRLGILDGYVGSGQGTLVNQVNEHLLALGQEISALYVVDYAGLVSRFGAANWFDARMAHYAKAPIARPMLGYLAKEYAKYFRAITGKSRKCVVVDLDNTLWGGVVGEEGVRGIQLGATYPGSAYQMFQRDLLNLQKRGIILAVSSKNNEADVQIVFSAHDQMVLKREHFSAWKVNWNPKSQSIIEIAKELNIGLDQIVFVDDNLAECEQVSSALPTVTVIPLPKQPEQFSVALLDEGLFDRLSLSEEDLRRSDLYRQRANAEALRAESGSLKDYYRSLEMETTFNQVNGASLSRAAQLTQKTNQFNVTTIRYSESDLRSRLADPEWILTTVQVRDRFGDNGIVGLMMAQAIGQRLEIDTCLLSCRVIGRTVETAMMAYLVNRAAARGLETIVGRIIPTAKNEPVRDLFERHGFTKVSMGVNGEIVWSLSVKGKRLLYPEWMRIIELEALSIELEGK